MVAIKLIISIRIKPFFKKYVSQLATMNIKVNKKAFRNIKSNDKKAILRITLNKKWKSFKY